MGYKEDYSTKERLKDATLAMEKFPGRIPVIIEKHPKSKIKNNIDKNKYLVPKDLSFGKFIYILRKRIQISDHEALFVTIDGKLPSTNDLMISLYEIYKDSDDSFLYMYYDGESTFG